MRHQPSPRSRAGAAHRPRASGIQKRQRQIQYRGTLKIHRSPPQVTITRELAHEGPVLRVPARPASRAWSIRPDANGFNGLVGALRPSCCPPHAPVQSQIRAKLPGVPDSGLHRHAGRAGCQRIEGHRTLKVAAAGNGARQVVAAAGVPNTSCVPGYRIGLAASVPGQLWPTPPGCPRASVRPGQPWSSDRVWIRPCASVARNCTSVPAAGRSTPRAPSHPTGWSPCTGPAHRLGLSAKRQPSSRNVRSCVWWVSR